MKEVKDLRDDISSVVKTGKVVIGSNRVIKTLLIGNPKLIILSSNCPDSIREDIIYYSRLSKIPYSIIKDDSTELGSICGKPFPVSAIGIVDEGESDILTKF
ncbi:MAG TPA: 50S ribosomal protein L30e [Candidatus Altiarchaeales archaeon]|nr:MAG: 50S ribosomal protein L30e [Candidatus Altiarchaeales archaeon]HDH40974.1 50S ribosomal protein L30e [Candidatus Altiarchaeales archaeon]